MLWATSVQVLPLVPTVCYSLSPSVFLTIISMILIICTLPLSLFVSIKVSRPYKDKS